MQFQSWKWHSFGVFSLWMCLICSCRWVCEAEIILVQMIWEVKHIKSIFVARGLSPLHAEALNNPLCHHPSIIFMKSPSVLGSVPSAVQNKANTWRLEPFSLELFTASHTTSSILEYTAMDPDPESMFWLEGRPWKAHHHKCGGEGN